MEKRLNLHELIKHVRNVNANLGHDKKISVVPYWDEYGLRNALASCVDESIILEFEALLKEKGFTVAKNHGKFWISILLS